MTNTCPECGASMDFERREVSLSTGTCPSCAKEFAFVEGPAVSSRLASRLPAGAARVEAPEGGPECAECGSPLEIREGRNGSLEAVCSECETTTVFVPQREAGRPERGREPRGRPDEEGPRGRPCRRCGGTLRFSTGEDGMLVGECESCGNRFTLPPREDRGRDREEGRGSAPYGRRPYRPRAGSRSSYQYRGSDRGGRPFRGTDRRGPPRFDDEDRRRKRRRRDE